MNCFSLSKVYRSTVIVLDFLSSMHAFVLVSTKKRHFNPSTQWKLFIIWPFTGRAQKSDHVIRQLINELLWKQIQSNALWDKNIQIMGKVKTGLWALRWQLRTRGSCDRIKQELPAPDHNTMDAAAYLHISSGESVQRPFPECKTENRLGITNPLFCDFL